MCKKGDIILIEDYVDSGTQLSRHSFVVIEDKAGEVTGVPFDFIGLAMSSFKDEAQKKRKLSYPGNMEIAPDDEIMNPGANHKTGYIKADQFYYFAKAKTSFSVIGSLTAETLSLLFEFIESLFERGIDIKQIVDNL